MGERLKFKKESINLGKINRANYCVIDIESALLHESIIEAVLRSLSSFSTACGDGTSASIFVANLSMYYQKPSVEVQ
jgi:hypothetical protein